MIVTMEEISERVTRLEGKDASKQATRPSIVNVALDSANTEYRHKLPLGCKRFQVQMRDTTNLLIAFEDHVLGQATPNPKYFTIKSGTVLKVDGLNIDGDIWLYLQSGTASKVAEIIQWT